MLCCNDCCPKYKDCARACINAEYKNTSTETATLYVPSETEAEVKYQWQIDIEDLQRQMKEVKKALQRLEVSMSNGHSDLVETTQM